MTQTKGQQMNIKMPIYTIAKCVECGAVDQYAFGPYGSESPCYICDAAPIQLIKETAQSK